MPWASIGNKSNICCGPVHSAIIIDETHFFQLARSNQGDVIADDLSPQTNPRREQGCLSLQALASHGQPGHILRIYWRGRTRQHLVVFVPPAPGSSCSRSRSLAMRSFTGILSGALLVLAARVAAQASPRGLSDAALPIYARKPSCPVGQYDHGNGCITCPAGYMCPGALCVFCLYFPEFTCIFQGVQLRLSSAARGLMLLVGPQVAQLARLDSTLVVSLMS